MIHSPHQCTACAVVVQFLSSIQNKHKFCFRSQKEFVPPWHIQIHWCNQLKIKHVLLPQWAGYIFVRKNIYKPWFSLLCVDSLSPFNETIHSTHLFFIVKKEEIKMNSFFLFWTNQINANIVPQFIQVINENSIQWFTPKTVHIVLRMSVVFSLILSSRKNKTNHRFTTLTRQINRNKQHRENKMQRSYFLSATHIIHFKFSLWNHYYSFPPPRRRYAWCWVFIFAGFLFLASYYPIQVF